MSIGNIFSRKGKNTVVTQEEPRKYTEDDVLCDDWNLKEYVSKWCENEGYKFEGIAMFLEKAGIELPVKLSKLDKSKRPYNFQCIDSSENEYTISLVFGDFIDICSEIDVTEKSEELTITKRYDVGEKYEGELAIPYMFLSGRTIEKEGITLTSFFTSFFCSCVVKVDESYVLEFEVGKPFDDDSDDNTWAYKKSEAVEEYLLTYHYACFDVDELYAKLEDLFELKTSNISHVLLKYEKCMKEDARCLAMISVNHGVVDSYGYVTEGEKSFWVSNEGDWRFSSEYCKISYTKMTGKLKYSLEGDDEEISRINPVPTIENVKEQISKIWSKVGL